MDATGVPPIVTEVTPSILVPTIVILEPAQPAIGVNEDITGACEYMLETHDKATKTITIIAFESNAEERVALFILLKLRR